MRSLSLILSLVTGALAGSTAPRPDGAEIVRLKVGTEIAVELDRDTFDEARGVHARRVSDGAKLELHWDQLHPDDVHRIRASFGYLPDEPEPVMVEATRITLSGNVQLTGFIESSDGEVFVFRQPSGVKPIRWSAVRRQEIVTVDALEVHDPEVLYTERLSQSVPDTPLEHYNTALFCESLQLWERVKEHLDAVVAADPEFKRNDVASKLKRSELRLRYAEDAGLLAHCERLAKRDRYDDALVKIEEFLTQKPDSSLAGEFVKAQRSIEVRREKWLRGKVNANFFFHVDRFAQKLAGEAELPVEAARKEMQNEATEYAIDAVAKQFSIDPEEAREFWEAEDRPHGSARTASYGAGTFTLGEQRAFEGLEKAQAEKQDEEKEDEGSAGGDPDSVQERIRRLIEERRREQERRESGGREPQRQRQFRIADVPPDKEEWWLQHARIAEKRAYLMAWWAENEDRVDVVRFGTRPCPRCAGKGTLGSITSQGGNQENWCPRCKGLRIDRMVIFH